MPLVAVVMGSKSDAEVMKGTTEALDALGISYEVAVVSAHRTPEKVRQFGLTAREKGFEVIIAGAGAAAHLAGTIAAHTTLPVIGVPLDGSPLKGIDALLATIQMPSGIPVATMALGAAGATNAGVLAAQILALGDPELAARLAAQKNSLAEAVERAATGLANRKG